MKALPSWIKELRTLILGGIIGATCLLVILGPVGQWAIVIAATILAAGILALAIVYFFGDAYRRKLIAGWSFDRFQKLLTDCRAWVRGTQSLEDLKPEAVDLAKMAFSTAGLAAVMANLIALLGSLVAVQTLLTAYMQVQRLDTQNRLLSSQNELIESQNLLAEAERRSSERENIRAIDDALNQEYRKLADNKASAKTRAADELSASFVRYDGVWKEAGPAPPVDATALRMVLPTYLARKIARIALTCTPYRYLDEAGKIIPSPLSPERGQLLLAVAGYQVHPRSIGSATFEYADLRGAQLAHSDLRGLRLRYADLSRANLRYADLRYANLSGASVEGARLDNAVVESPKWPEDAGPFSNPPSRPPKGLVRGAFVPVPAKWNAKLQRWVPVKQIPTEVLAKGVSGALDADSEYGYILQTTLCQVED